MKLDRDINKNEKGKYALVRLRTIEKGSEAQRLLDRLDELGVLDCGYFGQMDEFFVIKLRDKYADAAISAYVLAVMLDANRIADENEYRSLVQYGLRVQELLMRSGSLSKYCKRPD